jgi:hypothetical protein
MVSNLNEFLKKRAIVGIVGGIWAEIPEIDYLIEGTVFHTSEWSNIFFFHYSLDEVLPETDLFFAAEMFLIFAAINLFALVASVESFKRLKEALFGKEEDEEEEEMGEEEDTKEKTEEAEREAPKEKEDYIEEQCKDSEKDTE